MKTRTCFSLILLLCALMSFAQNQTLVSKLEVGKLFKNDKREIPISFVGEDSLHYYIVYARGRFGHGDKSLRKFNKDFAPTGNELNLESPSIQADGSTKKSKSLGTIKMGNSIFHLWQEELETSVRFFSQKVGLKDFNLIGKQLVASIPKKPVSPKRVFSYFVFDEFEEGMNLIHENPFGDENTFGLSIKRISEELEVMNEVTYEFDFPKSQFFIEEMHQTAANQFLVLAKFYFGKNTISKENKKEYEHILFKLNNGELTKVTTISTRGKHLRRLEMLNSDSGEVILSGIFAQDNLYNMGGVYFCKIDVNAADIITEKYHPISAELSLKLLEDGKRKQKLLKKRQGNNVELPYYVLKDIIPINGEKSKFLLLAEQIHSMTVYGQIKYYHDNVMMFMLDEEGILEWSNVMGKRQQKDNVLIYSSFKPIVRENKVHLFYNGSSENQFHLTGKLQNAFNASNAFYATSINEDGTYVREIVTTAQKLDGIFIRPSLYNWLDDDTIVFFGQDMDNVKNQRFIKMILD